jgi:hypothetical protein
MASKKARTHPSQRALGLAIRTVREEAGYSQESFADTRVLIAPTTARSSAASST